MGKRKKNKRSKSKRTSQSAQAVIKQNQFEVVVLATMSAGKSTIINALIGTDLLPSSNQACTARVFKIEDHDGMEGFKATVVNSKTGKPSSWVNASPDTLKQLNDSDEKGTILIQGDIKSILNQDMNLAIYDTPGPNNSQDDSHGQITRDILSDGNFGLVLYALNATQIGVEDDSKLLHDLFDLIGTDLDHKEVVFILNKADQLDEGLGEDLDAVVEKVEAYLERHGFKTPTIIPLSSIAALLARKLKNNEPLTSKEKRTYRSLIGHTEDVEKPLYEHAKLSEEIKEKLKESASGLTEIDRLIQYSGITSIEYLLHQKLRSAKHENNSSKDLSIARLSDVLKKVSLSKDNTNNVANDRFEVNSSTSNDVTILGSKSAGKSTVINAMVGKELLPSKNEACNATIARVINEGSMQEFMVRRLGEDGEVIDDWQTVTEEEQLELVSQWNEDKATSTIELKGNIPAIYVRDGIQMVLVDTPGPNNSNDASHRAATVRAINNSQPSMVLYVLNATQLGVDDDNSLLGVIKEAMAKGGREAHDRFIFIANKIDTFDPVKEPVASVITSVKTYLEKNGIINPVVIPVSAELAKLIRTKRFYGEDALTRKQKGMLNILVEQFVEEEGMNLLERSRNDLPRAVYQKLKKQVDEAKAQNDDEKLAELLSGVPIIETLLDTYLMKHAVPSRIKDAVQTFNSVAHENDIKQKLNDVLRMSESELSEAVSLLENFNNSKSRIEQAAEFRERVNALKYTASNDAKIQRIIIDQKINKLLDDLSTDFKEKLPPERAEGKMSNAERKANFLVSEIQEMLAESLQRDLEDKAMTLKAEYDLYVQDLLGGFPDSDKMSVLKSLQSSSLKLPDVKNLIQKSTFEEQKIELVGTERYGFLWLSKRNVYKTSTEERVDMQKLGKDFEEGLAKIRQLAWNDFEKTAENNFYEIRKTLLDQMNLLDERFNKILEDLKEASMSKNEKQKALEENKTKNSWYLSFEKRLKSVLAVG
jgi:GTPase Era involved in 16S rRNA processing